ncbi:MAG TPA: lyase family protein [Vicinamibacterales bacterium]|nr:lyase family protein [Vicinamibacterales bacterium]
MSDVNRRNQPVVCRTALATSVVLLAVMTWSAGPFSLTLHAQSGEPRTAAPRDGFYWLNEQNKASLVMLTEQKIITRELASKIAGAVTQVIDDGARPGAARARDYLVVEADMIKIGGPDVTRIHSGRSRQDLGQTSTRLMLRDAFLTTYQQFIGARATLLAMAETHPHAILPFYTHGVQAQPISLGHYLGGYLEAMSRSSDRYQQAWVRLNQSPLGGAAGGTSSFPVNRARLAELLGFDGIIVNSFDSGQISNQDNGVELSTVAASGALTVSMLAADLTMQYADPHPWFQLTEGAQTGISSIMPQKRNPTGLENLHLTTSTVTGQAVTFLIQANNVMSGMGDYKGDQPRQVVRLLGEMYDDLNELLTAMVFNPERAKEEVDSDYSMTTELADILQREAEVPFRVGHHFASDIVTYGRRNRLKPAQIPYVEAQSLFTEAWKAFGRDNQRLPLTEAQFRRALSGENMVESAKPVGGPQPAEVLRMLGAERTRIQADREWLAATRRKLDDAAKMRDAGVAALR